MILEAIGLRMGFTGVRALDGVNFHLRQGEIHALMGENGAGKSTLIKCLTGVYQPDSGQLLLAGEPYRPSSPQHATELGISTVYQEINLAPNLSVAENICLGREPRGAFGIRWKEVRQRARAALARLQIELDVNAPLGSISVAHQQLVAIARALDVSCRALILDEPTSSLDRNEVEQLFEVLRRLKSEGMGILFVTHFLDQVYAISDRITVLRNGRLVGEFITSELPKLDLVSHMIGRSATELEAPLAPRSISSEAPFVSVDKLTGSRSTQDVDFSVSPGEVVGLAGLLGSGRTETLRMIYGIDPIQSGSIQFGNRRRSKLNVQTAIKEGLGLCPEDRKSEGILPDLSVRENLMLVVQNRRGWWRRLSRKEQQETVSDFIKRLQIATPDADRPIQFLSGGNQQKVLLARWLAANPKLLLLDEPTRGIDVGAKFEISNLIELLRQGGMSFLFVSSELEEVVRSSTKVEVLRDRRMVGELKGEEIDQNRIMGMIAGNPE